MLEKKVIKDEKNDQVKKEEPSIQSSKPGDRKTSNFSQVLARKILSLSRWSLRENSSIT